MKIRSSLMALALVMGLASASQAADLVRKVDSFDLVVDQSGSMMMKIEGTKMTKAAGAKQVLTSVVEALPDLGYKASAHTVAPAGVVDAYGDFDRAEMKAGLAGLQTEGAIFGKLTPMGDGLHAISGDFAKMARPGAVVLASDGASNTGIDPVAEVADVFYGEGVEDALVLHGVNFAFNSYALDAKAQGVLDEAAAALKDKKVNITLEGWTDSIGSDAYNKKLSQNRANAVKAYLVEQGVSAASINAVGMGKSFKFDNATEEGRYLNRRVEFIFN